MSADKSPTPRLAAVDRVLSVSSTTALFDQEQFTRELLLSKLTGFLRRDFFDVSSLDDMRRMVGDIFSEPVKSQSVPRDLRSVHCVHYTEFSVVNRRRLIDQTFQYIGLTEARAEYALTKDGWVAVSALAEKLCLGGKEESAGAVPAPAKVSVAASDDAQWSREVLACKLKDILADKRFDICEVDCASRSLNSLRGALGLPVARREAHAGYAGLRALHCREYAEMDVAQSCRIPAVILSVLGLSSSDGSGDGEVLLGSSLWAGVLTAYEAGIKVSCVDPTVQTAPLFKGPVWASLRAAVRSIL